MIVTDITDRRPTRAGAHPGGNVSFIAKLEDIAADLYDCAVDHANLVSAYAEEPDDRWVNAYNFIMDALIELDKD
jgi:hypothetical protein